MESEQDGFSSLLWNAALGVGAPENQGSLPFNPFHRGQMKDCGHSIYRGQGELTSVTLTTANGVLALGKLVTSA